MPLQPKLSIREILLFYVFVLFLWGLPVEYEGCWAVALSSATWGAAEFAADMAAYRLQMPSAVSVESGTCCDLDIQLGAEKSHISIWVDNFWFGANTLERPKYIFFFIK